MARDYITKIRKLGFDPADAIARLPDIVDKHLTNKKESARAFGLRAVRSPSLVAALRRGRQLRLSTVYRVLKAIGASP